MDTSTTIGHQFGIPVNSSTKSGVVLWPKDPQQEIVGIVTIPFRKGDFD